MANLGSRWAPYRLPLPSLAILTVIALVWASALTAAEAATRDALRVRYSARLSGALCGKDCGGVPVGGETALSGTVELVPQTTGLVVPTSAIVQQPSGDPAVTLADGTIRPVRIVAEADGFAVVEGLDAGAVIELPSPPAQ